MKLEVTKGFFKFKKTDYILEDINFSLADSDILSILGPNGVGKTTLIKCLTGLLPWTRGKTFIDGKKISDYNRSQMEKVRGNDISMIFQEPMSSLNPVFTVEKQISEVLILHKHMNKKEAAKRVEELLAQVKIPNPHVVAKQYPFELSGGMNQRVMIAMALACEPKLLIADEPTTALDVTIQAQILKLMNELKEKKNTSILFITHDLGVINQMADEVAVMYCGQIVEQSPVDYIFKHDITDYNHPYTVALLNSIPAITSDRDERLDIIPGSVPHPLNLPDGCKFADRCKFATEKCRKEMPELVAVNENQKIRCHFPNRKEREDGEK